jgi:hypothetical protein
MGSEDICVQHQAGPSLNHPLKLIEILNTMSSTDTPKTAVKEGKKKNEVQIGHFCSSRAGWWRSEVG